MITIPEPAWQLLTLLGIAATAAAVYAAVLGALVATPLDRMHVAACAGAAGFVLGALTIIGMGVL